MVPAAVWIIRLSTPDVVEETHDLVRSRLTRLSNSEGDVFVDTISEVVLLSMLTGVGGFILMRAYGVQRIVVVVVIDEALSLAGIAMLPLLAEGAGISSAKGPNGEDVFVVYDLLPSIALAIGATLGNAVVNRQ